MFADIFPGTTATLFDTNPPLKNTFVTTGLLAPGLAGSAQTAATSSNAAFVAGFNSGLNLAQISATVPAFTPPTITTSERNIRYPSYTEWNLELQQALGSKNSFNLNYVGNHGADLAALNSGLNGFCDAATPTPDASCLTGLGVTSFVGLPSAPPDPRFSTVSEVGNYGVSNYNGLVASMTRRVSDTFQLQASFTWSHALDDVSNGGFLPFNYGSNLSVLTPQDPYCFKCYNYGNADYDVRKQFNATYLWHTPRMHHMFLDVLANWTVSGTFFFRTGLPFTVVDNATSGALSGYGYGNTLFADTTVGPLSCSSANVLDNNRATPACMNTAQFTSPVNAATGVATFGNERRNQIYGPSFFNTDLTLMKNFRIPKWEGAEFQIGAQAFNVLNHPNFDQPVANLADPQFGYIVRTAATPTSIFGAFLGADASPRALQIRGQLRF